MKSFFDSVEEAQGIEGPHVSAAAGALSTAGTTPAGFEEDAPIPIQANICKAMFIKQFKAQDMTGYESFLAAATQLDIALGCPIVSA